MEYLYCLRIRVKEEVHGSYREERNYPNECNGLRQIIGNKTFNLVAVVTLYRMK